MTKSLAKLDVDFDVNINFDVDVGHFAHLHDGHHFHLKVGHHVNFMPVPFCFGHLVGHHVHLHLGHHNVVSTLCEGLEALTEWKSESMTDGRHGWTYQGRC